MSEQPVTPPAARTPGVHAEPRPHAAALKWALVAAAVLGALVFALAGPAGCRALRNPTSPHHEPLASAPAGGGDSRQ